MANERDNSDGISSISSGDSPRSVSSVSEHSAPGKVDKNDLQEGGWLLNQQQREAVKRNLDQKEQYRRGEQGPIFAKGERGYAVMRAVGPDGKVSDYAIYKGKGKNERNHALGQGSYGRVKLAQNLKDGTWDVVKIQIVCGRNLKEWIDQENKMLNEVGEGKGSVVRDKQLKGDRLDNLIDQLWREGLTDEANNLAKQAGENEAAGRGYYATVTEVVSVSTFAPGKTLTDVIESESLGESKPDYFNIARNIIQSYQSQIQGVNSNGELLPGRTMSLVHRDIKPDNIIIDNQGNARFVDLGMAHDSSKLSPDSGGTAGYKAPEINRGASASEQSDVYALGIVLAETFGFIRIDEQGSMHQGNKSLSRIPDPETSSQLYKLCQAMTDPVFGYRPDIRTCLKSLDAISPQLAQSVDSVPTGLVDTEAVEAREWYRSIPEVSVGRSDKEKKHLLDQAEGFRKEIEGIKQLVDEINKNPDTEKVSAFVWYSSDLEERINGSDLPDPAKSVHLRAISDLRIELQENNVDLKKDSSNQTENNSVSEAEGQLEELKNVMLEDIKKAKEDIENSINDLGRMKLSAKNPEQIIEFSEKVSKLAIKIREGGFDQGTKSELLSALTKTFDKVKAEPEQQARKKFLSRSLGGQMKDAIEKKILHKESTSEKLHRAMIETQKADREIEKTKESRPEADNSGTRISHR